jgi:galactose mutarotase-like enzyme
MSSCEQDLSDDGLQEIHMQNRHVCLSVLPGAGGKISKLVDRHSGRNWLWRNPHIPFRSAVYGADYGRELDSGGWDEVLLSMTPVELQLADGTARRIPDHGDVVGQQWTVVDASTNAEGDAVCEMTVSGRALNYEFNRLIKLGHDSPRLEIAYSLTNKETFTWPWYWSAHALLTGQHDLQIELPAKQRFRIDQTTKYVEGSEGHDYIWPHFPLPDDDSFDLSRCFSKESAPRDFARKIFVRSPDSGLVSVTATSSDERLAIHFDPEELPWLGLWINNRGWSGCDSEPYLNLGLEPSTAAFDCVSQAIDDDSITWLEAGQTRTWSIDIELQS